MSAKLKQSFVVFILIALTIFIYILTKNPITSVFKLQMALLSILVLIGFMVVYRKKENEQTNANLFTFLFASTVLFIVAATGWFYSPFFFSLYLLTILFAFIFGLGASIGFVGTLTLLFSFNVGEVDLAYDFLVVLSLLTTIPLSIYLRKEYLRLREAQKQILILQREHKEFQDLVEEVLSNKIVDFAANMRQPINDTKQLAYQMEGLTGKKSIEKDRDRIIKSADEALNLLKGFEEQVTGQKLVSHLNKRNKIVEENDKEKQTEPANEDMFAHAQPVSQASAPTLSKKP